MRPLPIPDVQRDFARQVLRVQGGARFLVAMTLQRGAAPPVSLTASGDGELLTIGGRSLRVGAGGFAWVP